MVSLDNRRIKLSRRTLTVAATFVIVALVAATILLRADDNQHIVSFGRQLGPPQDVPALLEHVFVGIVFHWDIKKLVFVKAVRCMTHTLHARIGLSLEP